MCNWLFCKAKGAVTRNKAHRAEKKSAKAARKAARRAQHLEEELQHDGEEHQEEGEHHEEEAHQEVEEEQQAQASHAYYHHDEQAYYGVGPTTGARRLSKRQSKHTKEAEMRIVGNALCDLASSANPFHRHGRKKGLPAYEGPTSRTWPIDPHDWTWNLPPPEIQEIAQVKTIRHARSDEQIIVPWEEFAESHRYR